MAILTAPDGRRHLVRVEDREQARAGFSRQYAAMLAAAQDQYVRIGIMRGDDLVLTVRDTESHQAVFERLAQTKQAERFQCVALLVRGTDGVIRVDLYGEPVGYAEAEEADREEVEALLGELHRRSKSAWVAAYVKRNSGGAFELRLYGLGGAPSGANPGPLRVITTWTFEVPDETEVDG